jgi:hypothetical protein
MSDILKDAIGRNSDDVATFGSKNARDSHSRSPHLGYAQGEHDPQIESRQVLRAKSMRKIADKVERFT